jgi:hypothetical protein
MLVKGILSMCNHNLGKSDSTEDGGDNIECKSLSELYNLR